MSHSPADPIIAAAEVNFAADKSTVATPNISINPYQSAQGASSVSPYCTVVPISQKRRRELERAEDSYKRCKSTITSVAEEYMCPITGQIPVDPVTAEDGRIYERSAIEKYIQATRNDLTSPTTKKPMGPRLITAVQVRNTIRTLVNSGVIEGELAMKWEERLRMDNVVMETRKKAKEGDTDALCDLADWYHSGERGLLKDHECAFQLHKKASDLGSARGMACEGCCLVYGIGAQQNVPYGAALVGTAAGLGSDLAALTMGDWCANGRIGFPKNNAKARYWLGKVVDGSSSVRHLKDDSVELARKVLEHLETKT